MEMAHNDTHPIFTVCVFIQKKLIRTDKTFCPFLYLRLPESGLSSIKHKFNYYKYNICFSK